MRIFTLLISLVALLSSQGNSQVLPELSSLVESCRLDVDELGRSVPLGQDEGIWLTCDGVRFLVVRPENLLGKVRVRSASQALEFVRFFSSRTTFGALHTGGCVEIADGPQRASLYAAEPRLFSKHLRPPRVESYGSLTSPEFVVVRSLVCPDQSVYEVTEQIGDDGMYFLTGKRRVLKSAKTVGVMHLPAH